LTRKVTMEKEYAKLTPENFDQNGAIFNALFTSEQFVWYSGSAYFLSTHERVCCYGCFDAFESLLNVD
jgi:hypothetical protein